MDALSCTLGDDPSDGMRIRLETVRLQRSEEARELSRVQQVATILVVDSEAFERIAAFEDVHGVIVPEGNNRGLPYHLFRRRHHNRIPAVHNRYSDGGGAKRSLAAALRNARESGIVGLFFVGAPDPVWHRLHEEAEETRVSVSRVENAPLTHRLLRELEQRSDPERIRKIAQTVQGSTNEIALVRHLILRARDVARSRPADGSQPGVRRPILILGETGTGKESIARAIHQHAWGLELPRFHAMNCASSSDELFEAELFGYMKGAFTGAKADRVGLWQAAGEGTLFLDEVGELGPTRQAKILRALQTNTVRRVGSTKEEPVTANVIAATNRDLASIVAEQRFREDLYFRLTRGLVITAPPLRGDSGQIGGLARRFWREIVSGALADEGDEPPAATAQLGARDTIGELGPEVWSLLTRLPWPGNVRQLKSVLEKCWTLFSNASPTVEQIELTLELESQLGP